MSEHLWRKRIHIFLMRLTQDTCPRWLWYCFGACNHVCLSAQLSVGGFSVIILLSLLTADSSLVSETLFTNIRPLNDHCISKNRNFLLSHIFVAYAALSMRQTSPTGSIYCKHPAMDRLVPTRQTIGWDIVLKRSFYIKCLFTYHCNIQCHYIEVKKFR